MPPRERADLDINSIEKVARAERLRHGLPGDVSLTPMSTTDIEEMWPHIAASVGRLDPENGLAAVDLRSRLHKRNAALWVVADQFGNGSFVPVVTDAHDSVAIVGSYGIGFEYYPMQVAEAAERWSEERGLFLMEIRSFAAPPSFYPGWTLSAPPNGVPLLRKRPLYLPELH